MGRPTVTGEHVQEAARRIHNFGIANGAVANGPEVVTFRPSDEAAEAIVELLGLDESAVQEINTIAAACESGGATGSQGVDAGFMIAMWAKLIAEEEAPAEAPARTSQLGAAYPHVRYDDLREAWNRVNALAQVHHREIPPRAAHTLCAFWGIDVAAFQRLHEWFEGAYPEEESRLNSMFWLLTGIFSARLAAGINDE